MEGKHTHTYEQAHTISRITDNIISHYYGPFYDRFYPSVMFNPIQKPLPKVLRALMKKHNVNHVRFKHPVDGTHAYIPHLLYQNNHCILKHRLLDLTTF